MEPGGREWKTVEAVELSPYDFHKLLCNLSIAIYIGSSFFQLIATRKAVLKSICRDSRSSSAAIMRSVRSVAILDTGAYVGLGEVDAFSLRVPFGDPSSLELADGALLVSFDRVDPSSADGLP
jgi:hypothetical protein